MSGRTLNSDLDYVRVDDALSKVGDRQRLALNWFRENQGREQLA